MWLIRITAVFIFLAFATKSWANPIDVANTSTVDEKRWLEQFNKLPSTLELIEFPVDSSVVKINNHTKYPIESILTLALRLQNVKGVTVDVVDYPYDISSPETIVYGFIEKYDFGSNQYVIYVTKDCSDVWELMMHEACHIAQYEDGSLQKVDSSKVIFKGDLIDFYKEPYSNRAHEADARARDYKVRSAIVNALI